MSRLGMPAHMKLDLWARSVNETFGGTCYLVGSSISNRDYNDVDVRCIVTDEQWGRLFPGLHPAQHGSDVAWVTICTAFSVWGSEQTGLPIDFQIQQRTWANDRNVDRKQVQGPDGRHPGLPRVPLGLLHQYSHLSYDPLDLVTDAGE
jgi:hypothetical protein